MTFNRQCVAHDARVVDEHVNPAILGCHGINPRLHFLPVDDVYRVETAARQTISQRLPDPGVGIAKRHDSALSGEAQGGGLSNASRAAGDQYYFIDKIHAILSKE